MDTKKLQYTTCILMIVACLLHLVQLFLYPVDPKWFIALTGTFVYAIANYGLYKNKAYGYYITVCVPIAGVVFVGVFAVLGLSSELGYGELNPFTLMAAVVEIPAIILSVYMIQQKVWL